VTHPSSPADWQLPPGVSRGLWDYLHDPAVAQGYDASLAGSALVHVDQAFVERYFPTPGKLIDLGCGTGRLLLPFARRGYTVLGVDLSEEMLRVAEAKASAAGVSVQLLRANLTELDDLLGGSFDYAACLFSTLGMVSGVEQRRRVVAHAYRLLRPGGRFVLHVHNRWFNFWNPQGRRWLIRNTLAALVGRAQAGDCLMPVHQGIANLTLHLFTRREASRLLREAGFRIREVKPVSLRADGGLRRPWWFGWLRAYGYLLAAERPS
jgi:2-polyprenyl-3-methyl-5-hydroxy-6-metoxy-1,4-benzoquinol methylase